MIRRLLFILLFFLTAGILHAQDDFGIWYATNIDYGLFKKVDFKFSGSIRTFNNASRIDQSFFDVGLQYKFAKNFSVAGYYRFINSIEDDGEYYYRHRLHMDLTATLPVEKFSFSARARFQRVTKTYIENEDDLLPQWAGRLRLKTSYKMASIPLKPYAYFESFTPYSPDFGPWISKYRLSAGAEVNLTRRISFDAGYIFQRDLVKKITNIHILSLELNFKF